MVSHGKLFAGDLLTCPKCLNYLDSPKSLPCLHTFCLQCIEDHCRGYDPEEDDVPCPVCRRHFEIPPRGVRELPNNFVVQSLVEAATRKAEKSNSAAAAVPPATPRPAARRVASCDVLCAEPGESGSGTAGGAVGAPRSVVVDRDRIASERCYKTPQPTRRQGKAHRARSLGSGRLLDSESSEPEVQSYCGKHQNEPVEIYCFDCGENMCAFCAVSSKHRQHKRREIAEAADVVVRQIDAHAVPVSSLIDDISQKMTGLNEKVGKSFRKSKITETAIRQTGEKVKQMVDRQVNALLAELEAADGKVFTEVESCKGKLQQTIVELEKFKLEWIELKSGGKRSDITQAGKVLEARAGKLLKANVAVECDVPDTEFVPGKLDKPDIGHLRTVHCKSPRSNWLRQFTLD